MKNLYTLSIIFVALALLVWSKPAYADGGHHGTHQYYHYHDNPHYGFHVAVFYPDEYFPVWAAGARYYYDDGIYYGYLDGSYVVVAPPVGAVVGTIPVDFKPVFINGVTYFTDNGIYYVHTHSGYQVVSQPVQAAHVMVVNTPNVVTVNVPGDRGAGFTIAN
jgi:hypothetical protein